MSRHKMSYQGPHEVEVNVVKELIWVVTRPPGQIVSQFSIKGQTAPETIGETFFWKQICQIVRYIRWKNDKLHGTRTPRHTPSQCNAVQQIFLVLTVINTSYGLPTSYSIRRVALSLIRMSNKLEIIHVLRFYVLAKLLCYAEKLIFSLNQAPD